MKSKVLTAYVEALLRSKVTWPMMIETQHMAHGINNRFPDLKLLIVFCRHSTALES